jgi:ABC-2 type transport system permease protein
LFCVVIDISLIEPVVFKNNDNDVLFSYPLTKNQIVFSKLFNVYLKNIFIVLVIMTSSLFAFMKFSSVNEVLVLLYYVCSLFIPFVPIVIITFVSYLNDYFKIKWNKVLFFISKYLLFALIIGTIILIVKEKNFSSMGLAIDYLIKGINLIYPMGYIFVQTIMNESVFLFLLYIFLNILFISLYNSVMSNNILKICSLLQGVNKNHHFEYKKSIKLNKTLGIIRKEIINLFNNKIYLFSSFGTNVVMLLLIVIGINMINIDNLKSIEYFNVYFNNFGPALLGCINTLNVMTISSISLEKENMQMFRTMPVSMSKILFSKWLVNILLSSGFVIVEAILFVIHSKINGIAMLLWFLLPLFILMFMTLTGLVLDYTFVSKKETSDNVIVRQRIIVFVPTVLSLVIGLFPVLINAGIKRNYFSGAYLLLMLIFILAEIVYLIINREKLLKRLFN